MKTLLVALVLAVPAFAQFELQVVEAGGARSAPPVYDLGAGFTDQALSARFRLRNNSLTNAVVSTIAVAGVGFSAAAPALPVTVEPGVSLEFAVAFRAPDLGGYSAVLRAANVTILLTASVQPRLTCRVEDAPCPATIDFGSAVRGAAVRRRFTVINETPQLLTVPAISIGGVDFVFAERPPSGTLLGPNQSAGFAIDFVPADSGPHQAVLTLGDRTALLTGTALEPPLPRPVLSVELKQAASTQQGALVITFDKPPGSAGSGVATLDFRGSADPTVAFAAGGRTTVFTVAPGDTRVSLPFQTGTTAGTLVFTVNVADVTDTVTVQIAPAAPVLTQVEGSRTPGGLEIRLTGWDNTHSVSRLEFTFYDAAGTAIQPGTIRVDGTAEFARFFGVSDLGGVFLLRAGFPVAGDTAQIASFDVSLSGLAGAAKPVRTLIR